MTYKKKSRGDFHFTSLFALDSLSHKLKQHSYKFSTDATRRTKGRGRRHSLPVVVCVVVRINIPYLARLNLRQDNSSSRPSSRVTYYSHTFCSPALATRTLVTALSGGDEDSRRERRRRPTGCIASATMTERTRRNEG